MRKNKKFKEYLVLPIMITILIFSSLSPSLVNASTLSSNVTTQPIVSDTEGLPPEVLEEMKLEGVSLEEINAMAEILETTFDDAILYDENGELIGYDDELLADELGDNPLYEEFIQSIEGEGVLASENILLSPPRVPNTSPLIPTNPSSGGSFIPRPTQPGIQPMVANCAWYGMKDSVAFQRAETACYKAELRSAYGPIAITATIANLISDKNFKLAAWHLTKLVARSNVAGLVATLVIIQYKCMKKMNKQYPGKTNCVAR